MRIRSTRCSAHRFTAHRFVFGKMHFMDLAGSEKLNCNQSGIRMQEAVDINKSLSALGKCIISLSNPSKFSHIPYRDSKLTRLLQSSLSGNCYTSLIATINPNECNYDETLSTLTFAHRCTNVYTRAYTPIISRTRTKYSNCRSEYKYCSKN